MRLGPSGPPATGSYKLSGAQVTFVTGPYGQLHYHGKRTPTHAAPGGEVGANLALLNSHSRPTGISCYPH